jgi:hypothetical protein
MHNLKAENECDYYSNIALEVYIMPSLFLFFIIHIYDNLLGAIKTYYGGRGGILFLNNKYTWLFIQLNKSLKNEHLLNFTSISRKSELSLFDKLLN